jgi:septation ring formation regulator EzrA
VLFIVWLIVVVLVVYAIAAILRSAHPHDRTSSRNRSG